MSSSSSSNSTNSSSISSNTLPKGAVVTSGCSCEEIPVSILNQGGTVVEAAIAALICDGILTPQSLGLGGGFLMTIYLKSENKADFLNAREVAPGAAYETMFVDHPTLRVRGGLSVAVPAELKGYWCAYQKYGGKIPWKDLIRPSIDLCKNGCIVTECLEKSCLHHLDLILENPGLSEIFIDPKTKRPYKEGQVIKRLKLGETLEIIAEEGGEVLNGGTLTEDFARDIQNAGGIVTADDLRNYKPIWQEPIKMSLPFKQQMITSPLPGGGVLLAFIMNLLNGFLDLSQPNSVANWQRIVESFKYAYGKRTELGDPNFVDNIEAIVSDLTSLTYAENVRKKITNNKTLQDPEYYGATTVQPNDHGTSHFVILAPNGDAVSVTSTINLNFGAGFVSESTGIILNNQMDDFSCPGVSNSFKLPASPANYIKPGKRPLSSMSPTIILDENQDVILVVGAAGGTKITTSVALVAIKNLWFNVLLEDAIKDKRLHHQLLPMEIHFEDAFETEIVEGLAKIGHRYKFRKLTGFTTLTAISKQGGRLEAVFDPRRPGGKGFVY